MNRLKQRVLFLAVAICGAAILGLVGVLPLTAEEVACEGSYTVVPGDYLFAIANRHDVAYEALMACNPQIRNPNRIYVGQHLAMPSANLAEDAAAAGGHLALEVTYHYLPTNDEKVWKGLGSGGIADRRLALPLLATYPISFVGAIEKVATQSPELPSPHLALHEAGAADVDGTTVFNLILVNQPEVSNRLPFSGTMPALDFLCEPAPVAEALGGDGVTAVTLTLWLEQPEGDRYPFPIVALQSATAGNPCSSAPALQAVADDQGAYQVDVRLNHDINGPPSPNRTGACNSWRNSGWLLRWFRVWYGC